MEAGVAKLDHKLKEIEAKQVARGTGVDELRRDFERSLVDEKKSKEPLY